MSVADAAHAAFRRTANLVVDAKDTLLLGVPSGRPPRLAFAEALAGFEEALRQARAEMNDWRIEAVESEWAACLTGMERALDQAERLRLEVPTDAYEELVPWLDELLGPLDAFAAAEERFRALRE